MLENTHWENVCAGTGHVPRPFPPGYARRYGDNRGLCRHCGKDCGLRANGTVRRHVDSELAEAQRKERLKREREDALTWTTQLLRELSR